MCKVPEFDLTAVWEDPCRSYTLQDVICPNCNYCRDLDLCRDPSLITNRSDEWPCPQCQSTYDKSAIELTLVQLVEEMSAAYQCQDLRCPETQQVQVATMTDYCPESSKRYKCDISPEAIGGQLSTFLNIARYHEFEWLEEVVSHLLQIEYDGVRNVEEGDGNGQGLGEVEEEMVEEVEEEMVEEEEEEMEMGEEEMEMGEEEETDAYVSKRTRNVGSRAAEESERMELEWA